MSMYKIPEKTDILQCPFDNTHQVEAYRFQRHLSRCKKNHPDKDFVHCPFNHTHMIPKKDKRHHMANCPDKARLEMDLQADASGQTGDLSMPERETWHMPDDGADNWDDDISVNPLLGKLGSKGFQLVLPSQRKQSGRSRTEINQWLQGSGEDGRQWIESAEEFSDSRGVRIEPKEPELRLPHTAPQALRVEPPAAAAQSASQTPVFNYSLAMAGIGRGTTTKSGVGATQGVSVNRELLQNLGRGRGRQPGGLSNGHVETKVDNSVNGTAGGSGEPAVRPVGRGIKQGTSPAGSDSSSTHSSPRIGRGIGQQRSGGVSSLGWTAGVGRGVQRPSGLQNGPLPGAKPQFIIPNVNRTAGAAANDPER